MLSQLGVRPSDCIAFEDSANGVVAAQPAGLPVLATPSTYPSDDDFAGASSVVSSLGEPGQPHLHLAGWQWAGGVVTIDSLQTRVGEDSPQGEYINFF